MTGMDSTLPPRDLDGQDDLQRLIAEPIAWAERAIGEGGFYCRMTARDFVEILVALAMCSLAMYDLFLFTGRRSAGTGGRTSPGRPGVSSPRPSSSALRRGR